MILNTKTEVNLKEWTSKKGKKFLKPTKRLVCEIKCDHCGVEFQRYGHDISPKRRSNDYSHFCEKCVGQASIKGQISRRKNLDKTIGDRKIDSMGYPTIYVGKDYPYSKDYGGRIREHVIVMERHLKRALKHTGRKDPSSEVVHHIDGEKINNKLSNLQVMTQTEHNRCHAGNDGIVLEMFRKGIVGYSRKNKRYFMRYSQPHIVSFLSQIIDHESPARQVEVHGATKKLKGMFNVTCDFCDERKTVTCSNETVLEKGYSLVDELLDCGCN